MTRSGPPDEEQLRKELEAELQRRVQPLAPDLLARGPSEAIKELLARHGRPPGPDPVRQPAAYALWRRAFAPSVRFAKMELPSLPEKLTYRLTPSDRSLREALISAPVGQTRIGDSGNWSGAVIIPNHAGRFWLSIGDWRVPKPKPPPGKGDGCFGSSTWVGLDGYRKWVGGLPQVGTSQFVEVKKGVPTVNTYAWWQWWSRGQLAPTLKYAPFDPTVFPVAPGNEMIGLVIALGPDPTLGADTVIQFIANLATKLIITQGIVAAPTPVPYDGYTFSTFAKGTSAEWIMERPTRFFSDELYDLPKFDQVPFGGCAAVMKHGTDFGAGEKILLGAEYLRMYEVLGKPHRVRALVKTKLGSPVGFKVLQRRP